MQNNSTGQWTPGIRINNLSGVFPSTIGYYWMSDPKWRDGAPCIVSFNGYELYQNGVGYVFPTAKAQYMPVDVPAKPD